MVTCVEVTLAQVRAALGLSDPTTQSQWDQLVERLPLPIRRRLNVYTLALALSTDAEERYRVQQALCRGDVSPDDVGLLQEAVRLAVDPALEAQFYRFLGSDPQLVRVALSGRMRLYRELLPALAEAALHAASPRRILDVGSFAGIATVTLARLCPAAHVVGIEREPSWVAVAIDLAKRLGTENVRFELADCWTYEPRERFDQVWWLFVASGPEPRSLLKRILARVRAWLATGGDLVLVERWPREFSETVQSEAHAAGFSLVRALPVQWHCPAEGDHLQQTTAWLLRRRA